MPVEYVQQSGGSRRLVTDPSQEEFSPDGEGYDYETAIAAGMKPGSDQHWGSVAPVPEGVREKYGLPAESYVVLKGAKHPTWNKAVEGERARGFKVVRLDDRYYSVPAGWDPQDVHPSTGKPIPETQEEADASKRSDSLGKAPPQKSGVVYTEEKTGASKPTEKYDVVDLIRDTGLDFAQGAVDLGQSAVGIADIFTGNRVGKAMSDLGYRPEETAKIIQELHTAERQRQDDVVRAASGFWGTAQALGENPLSALGTISRSAPLTMSGAAVVRAAAMRMMAREGIAAGSAKAAEFLTRPDVVAKLTKIGTATEGLQAAGLNQEQAREAGKDWSSTVLPSVAAGIGTGLIGYGSSKIIPDVETTLATRGLMPGSRASLLARGKDVAKGILKEGGEETLQSGQEQMWSNVALDKPLMQGVPESMAQGAVAGAGTGGGMSAYSNIVDEARGIQDAKTVEAWLAELTKYGIAPPAPPAEPAAERPATWSEAEPVADEAVPGRLAAVLKELAEVKARRAEMTEANGYGVQWNEDRGALFDRLLRLEQERKDLLARLPKIREQEGGGPPGPGAPRGGVPPSPPTAPMEEAPRAPGATPDAVSVDDMIATGSVSDKLAFKNPVSGSAEEKAAQLLRLGEENAPLVRDMLSEIDWKYGTSSKDSFKDLQKIIEKANRPTIKEVAPEFGVEHIRDAYRFKTVLEDASVLPEILSLAEARGMRPVKIDTDMLVNPKKWGFRAAVVDMQMPNGQLVEWYLPVREIEEVKDEMHKVYEVWRNEDVRALAPERLREYEGAVALSQRTYGQAWNRYLKRTGQDERAVRAALARLSSSMPVTESKSRSSVSGVSGRGYSESGRQPLPGAMKAPTPPEITTTTPFLSRQTMGESVANPYQVWNDEEGRAETAGQVYRNANGSYTFLSPETGDRLTFPNEREARAAAARSATPEMRREGPIVSEAPETLHRHMLQVQRGERGTGRARLTTDEVRAAAVAASELGTTPQDVEAKVRAAKRAHPESGGWAPLAFLGTKKVGGKRQLKYQTIPYTFSNGPDGKALVKGTPEYTERARALAGKMRDKVRDLYERAKGGEEEAIKILSQARWYRAMREALRRDFGGLGDLFADLLGATSPQTPVRTNWDSAIDALRQATTGAYDKLIPKWEAWVEEVDQFNTEFLAFFNEKQEQGLSKKAIKELPEYKAFEERAKTVRELPDELKPTKANGKLFGVNTDHVVRALVGLWRTVRVANEDIGAGGQAPKALNFSGNLIGFKTGATIDVWAARMLQDLSGGLRIPYEAEVGVSGTLDPGGTSSLQFGFGQDVFHEAAGMIRSDPEMSSDKNLKEIADDDLQAVVWFLEKEKWTKNNWTSAAGEGGSFEFERALAGVNPKEQERVRELRTETNTTVYATPAQRRHAQEQLRLAQLQMETMPRVAKAKATLKRNQVERAKLGRSKDTEARREALAQSDKEARAELAAARETRAYQTLQKQAEAAKAVLAKPTLEESKASRKAAADELAAMARGVDRFTTGVTTATEEHVPTDKEMASLIKKVTDAVRKGDPGATLVALKAIATEGRYGQVERSLDMEVIVRAGFDARPLARTIFQVAKDSGQDTAFLARVLRQDEEYDPLLHHPGVEIYFRNQMEAEEAARYMANILETRVAKARADGTLTHFQVGGYTVIVDGRPTAETKAGKMGRPVGMRVIYMPEYEARYGIDERLKDATPEELTAIVEERKGDLEAYAKEVLRAFPNVSYAGLHHYEVDVRFAGEYEEAINGYSERSGGDAAQAGRSQVWQGRSLGEGIAAAVGRLQAAEGRAAGTLSDGDQAGPRVAEDVAPPKKAAAPPKLRGQKAGAQGVLWPLTKPPKEKATPKWLGLNIAQQIKTEGSSALVGKVVQSAEDLATLAQVYRDPRYETFRYFFVDNAGKIVFATGVSSRLPAVTGIVPAGMSEDDYVSFIKETMATSGATGYYLMHNHPSGNPRPSFNDVQATVTFADRMPGFLGHVIINSNKYAYLSAADIARFVADGGFSADDMDLAVVEKKFHDKDPLLTPGIPNPYLGLKVRGPEAVGDIGALLKRPGYAVLVGIDARMSVRALMEVPEGDLTGRELNLLEVKDRLKDFAVKSGSHFVGVYATKAARSRASVDHLIEHGFIVDWVSPDGEDFSSYREENPMVMPRTTMTGEQVFHFGERPEMNASVVMENFAQDGRYDLVATGARKFKAPKKTVKAYKLFRVARDGTLRPLFIDKSTPVPVGQWIPATHIPTKGYQERPGWHAGHMPIAPHLRQKSTGRVNANRVWAEVEMPADVDWQTRADASRTRDIRDQVPAGGYYKFATNKMQGDAWMIGGALKINRVLSDKEVTAILQGAGYTKAQIDGEMHPGGEPRTAHSLKAAGFRHPTFEADLADQIRMFEAAAAERGYASVDELASREPIYFEEVAREWREMHPGAGVLDGIIAAGMVHLSTDRSHHVRIAGPEADLQRARSVLAGRYGRMESDLRHVGGELQVTIPSWYSMDEVADSMKGLGLEVEATPAQEARAPGDALAEQWARALANVPEGEITATGRKRDVTQTKEFKEWFGDSKVVDEQGRPLVVYHGTYSKFDTFTPGRAGAIYFFPSRQAAAGYGPNVVAAYLKASRIADLTDPSSDGYKIAVKAFNDRGGWSDNEDAMEGRSNPNFDPALDHTWEMFDWGALREPLREAGFDGVKLNEYGGKVSYAVFEPTQVKSADKNNGDFDKTNPIITASRHAAAVTETPEFKRWFGNSKVVDARGRPLVVYHGTAGKHTKFDSRHLGKYFDNDVSRTGFFFVQEEWVAQQFAEYAVEDSNKPDASARVVSAYLSLQNPVEIDGKPFGATAQAAKELAAKISNAKRSGHDGAIIRGWNDGSGAAVQYIAFHPTQIKSATDNNGDFDPKNPIITGTRRSAPLWYSKLTRAVAGHKMAAMPATQWSSWLETAAPKLGIPKDEIEWSGLREWLSMQKGKLTRDQVRAYLEQNGVKVEEVELGGEVGSMPTEPLRAYVAQHRLHTESAADWSAVANRLERKAQFFQNDGNDAQAQWYFGLAEEATQHAERAEGLSAGGPKFRRWQLPGGTNYREIALTLPRRAVVNVRLLTQEEIDANSALKKEGAKAGDWWGVIDDSGRPVNGAWRTRKLAEEVLDDMRTYISSSGRAFTGVEPELYRVPMSHGMTAAADVNRLAHVRFNERTDADGKRVLFIEELQSDWAQQGRKEGFGDTGRWSAESRGGRLWEIFRDGESQGTDVGATAAEAISNAKENAGIPASGIPSAPFVTDTKAWVALALKRMIRYAAENGFDRIAWTTGEQQAERWDLSKQVARVTIQQMDADRYALIAVDNNGSQLIDQTITKPEDAEEYIGKEPTAKLIKDMGNGMRGQVSGPDLKVGGEGMQAFYGDAAGSQVGVDAKTGKPIYPIMHVVANDVLKKLGGGRVGATPVKNGLTHVDPNTGERIGDAHYPQPGFDITPELREKVVTEGMAVMGSRHEPPVWYSRLDKLIGEHKMKGMIPSQWKAWLESKAKQEGLGEEVFWSGITEYLGKWNRALPLSKEMLRSYLAQRGIKIKTTVLTSDPRAVRERAVEEAIASYEIAAEGDAERTENLALVRKLGQEYIEKGDVRSYNAFADEVGVPRDTFHTHLTQAGYELEPGYDRSGFQLPGGTNYREIVLSLPAEVTRNDDGSYEAEWLGRRGTGKTEQAALERAGAYLGGHYGDKPNVVGHLRVTDRMINGKRVYFIEEVQSDWAQTGRDEGFADKNAVARAAAEKAADALAVQLERKYGVGIGSALRLASEEEKVAFRDATAAVDRLSIDGGLGPPPAPFVRNTEGWVTLLLKHAVMDAIRGGYDAIAWTTGAQQAARYKLSRFVNALHVTHLDVQVGRPPMLRLDAYDRNGNLSMTRDVEPKKLAGYIGKELAADVMEQLERQGAAKVEGVDLDMGSEAMTRFYGDASGSQVGVDDNNKPLYPIMHLVANKLLRRLGGENVVPFDASVESVSVIQSAEGGYKVLEGASVYSSHTSEEAAQKAAAGLRKLLQGKIIEQQPGFVITPAMRDTILSKGMAVVGSQSTATQNGEWQEPAPESVARAARILAGRTDVMETIGWNKGDRLQSLDPDQVHLMSRLIAAALEAGVPEANFHATSFYTYPMIYSGNDAEYIGTYKIVGVSSDNLNRVIALERVLARIKGEGRLASAYRGDVSRMLHQLVGDIIHETSHLLDDNPNKRTNGGDFRTSASSEFAMEHDKKRGTITVNSELMREVMEVWASGPTRLQDDLDYPIRFVFQGDMDTKTAKSEVLAQLTMLYFTKRDLMREHMPVAYKFLEAIYEGDVRPKSIHEAHARVQGAIRALPHQWPNHVPATWRAARVREPDATGARKWRAGSKLGGRRTAKGPGGGQRGADGGGTGAAQSPAAEVQRAVDALNVQGVVHAARAATGGQAYKDRVSVAWKWIDDITSINRIPNLDSYLIMRKLALGQLSRVDDTVRELYDLFKDAGAHSADIYNFLTSKGASPTIIADQRLRAAAVRAKNLMIRVGEQLVARGLLDPATFAANRGAYLPRLYLAHLLGDEFVTAVSSGKRPSAMNYLKRRKDLSAHVREVILGEIKDPAFLVSKGFGVASRDMVLIDWMAQIAQNRDWVLPGTLVDWQGRRVTPYWLLKTADRIEMQADYYQGQAKIDATNTAAAMRTAARAALNSPAWANVPKGWKQLPDTPRYGQLRGMVVRSEIYEDIVGNVDISGDEMSWARYMMGPLAEKATGLWKWSKVAANPPAQVRNAISNLIMLHLSGVPAHRLAVLLPKAIEEYMTKGGYYQIFVKYGGKEGTFAVQELFRTDREFRDTLSRMAGKGDLMAGLRNIAGRIYDATGDAYQWVEGVGKLIKIMDEMERNGATEERAVLEADRWLFDYSLVNPAIRDLRRMPIGVPFLTFYTKALPRLLEAALLRPWKFAPYLAIPILLAQMLAGSADVDDDDVEALLKALPEWLQKRGHGYILPMKDASGRWVAVDFGYFFPWTMWTEMLRNVNQPAELLLGAGALGGPIPEIVAALKTGIDPFTGDKIVRPGPPSQQVADVMQWIWNLSAPGWLTERGAAHKMWQALGTPDLDRDGYPKSTVGQAALRFVGVNLYPINPDITRARNLRRMKYEIQELRAQMSKDLRGHPTMSAEDRREVIESYQDEIKAIQEKMVKYEAESRVHPNLRTTRPTATQAE